MQPYAFSLVLRLKTHKPCFFSSVRERENERETPIHRDQRVWPDDVFLSGLSSEGFP
jgi:hypothetical protein